MATISWLDVVLVVMLVASITFGFHQGFLRQGFLLLSIYVAAVLAAQYHVHLSALILAVFPSNPEVARVMAFVALLVALSIVVTWVVWTAYSYSKLPDMLMLDSFGGAALGGIIGALSISLTLVLVRYALQAPWPEGSAIKFYLHAGLANSSLESAFHSSLPLIHAALLPWLPEGIPMVING